MSNQIQKLQNAQAFFSKMESKQIKSILFSLSCAVESEVKDVDNLHLYEKEKVLELINTQVHFGAIQDTLDQAIESLEKEEAKA